MSNEHEEFHVTSQEQIKIKAVGAVISTSSSASRMSFFISMPESTVVAPAPVPPAPVQASQAAA